jgi:hypothetical protein
VAEEAAKLLAAVQAWAGEALAETAAPGPGEGATCGWCPVCQAVDRVRGTSPEVREHLATGVTSLLHGAASLLEAVAEHQRARASGDTSDPDRPPTP